jgi:hypothetical protein
MPARLPISVDDILAAIKESVCPSCHGLGRWRRKQRCLTCNGKGATPKIVERCTICQGRGQVPTESAEPIDCPLCDGHGVIYEDCWECGRTGCLEGSDDYCEPCSGAGVVPFACRVAKEADLLYLRHVLDKLIEYSRKQTQEDLVKACKLDALLLDVRGFVNEQDRTRADRLLPAAFRVAFGDARVSLKQSMRAFEERAASERLELRSTFVQEMSRLRTETKDLQDAIQGQFWSGLGHW